MRSRGGGVVAIAAAILTLAACDVGCEPLAAGAPPPAQDSARPGRAPELGALRFEYSPGYEFGGQDAASPAFVASGICDSGAGARVRITILHVSPEGGRTLATEGVYHVEPSSGGNVPVRLALPVAAGFAGALCAEFAVHDGSEWRPPQVLTARR